MDREPHSEQARRAELATGHGHHQLQEWFGDGTVRANLTVTPFDLFGALVLTDARQNVGQRKKALNQRVFGMARGP